MSSIPLISGAAGSLASQGPAGRVRTDQATDATAQQLAQGMAADDVHQTEMTSDRDADGRRPWEAPAGTPRTPEEEKPSAPPPAAPDPAGLRGSSLDVQA